MIDYLLAVDGGGSGTRALVARADGSVLARAQAGPSALGQGVDQAWAQMHQAIAAAFASADLGLPHWGRCALVAGLSGIGNPARRAALEALLPPLAKRVLVSDGYIMLLGAHVGNPGVLVAAGTGSVGHALYPDRRLRQVGGWGFPVGDEGSGALLGLQAVRLAQAALDGRAGAGPLAHAVWQECGARVPDLAGWVARAGQHSYAQLAPLVFASAPHDAQAAALLDQAARELESLAQALDPQHSLPLAVCGSIGLRLQDRLSPALRSRLVPAALEPTDGALILLQRVLREKNV